MKVIFPKS